MYIDNRTVKRLGTFGLGLALAFAATVSQASDRDRTYEVEITNLMNNSQLTPILAAVHSTRLRPIFSAGDAPGEGLAMVAETGNTAGLTDELSTRRNSRRVGNVDTFMPDDAPLTFPGNTLEFTIEADQLFRFMSIASMVLPSNDTFMALDTVQLPTRVGSFR